MNDLSNFTLFVILLILILCSAYFSSSETSMMAINRYRLKNQANQGKRSAKRVLKLLQRPDRLIGVILIGNNFVNILASAICTILAMRMWGDAGIAAATLILTLVILIFAEVTPKTIAALHPERIAFPSAWLLVPLLKIFYPLVWIVNFISNKLIETLGVDPDAGPNEHLNLEELRTVVTEGALISRKRQGMLVNILDLEKVSVTDVMIPRHDIIGIDLEDEIDQIKEQLANTQHTRMPVFRGDINNVVGMLHIRNSLKFFDDETLSKSAIVQQTREPYFVPETTALHKQLQNFQAHKRRIALVVDEYGDVQGIITLEDILEEIVGSYTSDFKQHDSQIHQESPNIFIIDGGLTLRDINRELNLTLPTDGPKTMNGLVTETLETLPDGPISIKIDEYVIEVLHTQDQQIRSVKLCVTPKQSNL